MQELNFRDISLLDVLLDQEFVTTDELVQYANISLRTLLAEISLINDVLARKFPAIQIANQRGKGYYLDYPIDQSAQVEKLKRHCKNYLNISLNKQFRENKRIQIICRLFFKTRDYIKIEEIATHLNVSVATVNKDMKSVRDFLKLYDLGIQSIPYYGMMVIGKEQAIRSCMLDLLDIYSISGETLFFESGLEQYGLSKESFEQMTQQVRQAVTKTRYPLTDAGFKRVVKYLSILPFRSGLQENLSKKEQQLIRQLKEYELAEQLVLAGTSQAEIDILTIFILSNSEITEWSLDYFVGLFPEVDAVYEQIVDFFQTNYHLYLQEYDEVSHYLKQFCYQFYLKKAYHFIELEVSRSKRRIVKQLTSSMAFAMMVYFLLPMKESRDFQDALFIDFVMHLYNLISRLRNEYEPTNILVINDSGKIANGVLMNKIREYERYNVHYDYRYLYELETLDFTVYDAVFLSEGFNYDLEKIPLPTLTFNFFLNDEFAALLWSRVFSPRRKIGSVINYLIRPQIIELSGDFKQIVKQIAAYFIQLSNYQPSLDFARFQLFIETMILNSDYSKHSVNKLITLFATGEMMNRYFIFRLKEPVTIRDRDISSLQFVFLDLSKGLLEIKNGDSQLRRYTTQKDSEE